MSKACARKWGKGLFSLAVAGLLTSCVSRYEYPNPYVGLPEPSDATANRVRVVSCGYGYYFDGLYCVPNPSVYYGGSIPVYMNFSVGEGHHRGVRGGGHFRTHGGHRYH